MQFLAIFSNLSIFSNLLQIRVWKSESDHERVEQVSRKPTLIHFAGSAHGHCPSCHLHGVRRSMAKRNFPAQQLGDDKGIARWTLNCPTWRYVGGATWCYPSEIVRTFHWKCSENLHSFWYGQRSWINAILYIQRACPVAEFRNATAPSENDSTYIHDTYTGVPATSA